MKEDDRTLLKAFEQRQDEGSFRQLYRRHTPTLFALALRLCGSRAEAEELTQEAWVRAVENHGNFNWQSRYSTWLTGILINCFREAARHHAKTPLSFDETKGPGTAAVIATFPPQTRLHADAIDVERALSQLPVGYREIVILHDVSGHTHREIATMLHIQEGTSKSQLKRGRARLRELLTANIPSVQDRDERGTS